MQGHISLTSVDKAIVKSLHQYDKVILFEAVCMTAKEPFLW